MQVLPCEASWNQNFVSLKLDMEKLSRFLNSTPLNLADASELYDKISSSRLNEVFVEFDPLRLHNALFLTGKEQNLLISACKTETSVAKILSGLPNRRTVTIQEALMYVLPLLAFLGMGFFVTEQLDLFSGLSFITLVVGGVMMFNPSSHEVERHLYEALEEIKPNPCNEFGQFLIFLMNHQAVIGKGVKEWNQLKEAYEETRV